MADDRDNFLIMLNNCKSEINTKFKQISDSLLIRQNKLLTELDKVEKEYLEDSGIIQDEIQKLEKVKNHQKNALEGGFNLLQESVVTGMKDTIENLNVQIGELRQKLVAYTNIDIVLNTDNINTLIDKLGSVKLTEDSDDNNNNNNINIELDTDTLIGKIGSVIVTPLSPVTLTEDSEFYACFEYFDTNTDVCHIDPCESYNPHNKSNIDDICTDTIGKKRKQGNVFALDVTPNTKEENSSKVTYSEFETISKYSECPLSPTLPQQMCTDLDSVTLAQDFDSCISSNIAMDVSSKDSDKVLPRKQRSASKNKDPPQFSSQFKMRENSSPSISSSNDEDLPLQDTTIDATIKPEAETASFLCGINSTDKKRKSIILFKWPKGGLM